MESAPYPSQPDPGASQDDESGPAFRPIIKQANPASSSVQATAGPSAETAEDTDILEVMSDERRPSPSVKSLAETQYSFDENGILRSKDSGAPFPFKTLLVPCFKKRYDTVRRLTAEHVLSMLIERGMVVTSVPVSSDPHQTPIQVIHSPDLYTNRGTLLVLLQAGGVARPGVWCPRLLMHPSGGIQVASHIPQVDRALAAGYAVLIINANVHEGMGQAQGALVAPGSGGEGGGRQKEGVFGGLSSLRGEGCPPPLLPSHHRCQPALLATEERVHAAWRQLIHRSPARHLLVWAHLYAGTAFVYPLQPPPLSMQQAAAAAADVSSNRLSPSYTRLPAAQSPPISPSMLPLTHIYSTPPATADSCHGKRKLNGRRVTGSVMMGMAGSGMSPAAPAPTSLLSIGECSSQSASFPCRRSIMTSANLSVRLLQAWERRRARLWGELKRRTRAVVFTDSVVSLRMQGVTDKEVIHWFEQHSVHYVACVEPINKRVDESQFFLKDVPTMSAGTTEHDMIPAVVTEEAFRFFSRKLHEAAGPEDEIALSATSALTTLTPATVPLATCIGSVGENSVEGLGVESGARDAIGHYGNTKRACLEESE